MLESPEQTAALAAWLAPQLMVGDVILLDGPIGAGKSHFCRALIQACLAAEGRTEDIPSPTYTLVQVYEMHGLSIWHADLYRLTSAEQTGDQTAELGLDEAFDQAVTLVEWPDRMGDAAPKKALTISLTPIGSTDARRALLRASDPRWAVVFDGLRQAGEWPHE